MADRRRRKCTDLGSDESGDEAVLHNQSDGSEGGNSEYESVDEEELGEEEEDGVRVSNGAVEEPGKPLDDDEDRKNPQYIPKKGTFYEHDDRTVEESEETVVEEIPQKPSQEKKDVKKIWRDDDKWQHDRFVIYDQSPKSKEELVATYGYDIRNEEGPPRARRRRRYGRGPNKYTRHWEDYDAYSKPTRGKAPVRGGRVSRGRRHVLSSENDFPSLPNSGKESNTKGDSGDCYPNHIPSMQITPSDQHRTVQNNQEIQKSKTSQSYQKTINDDHRKMDSGSKTKFPSKKAPTPEPKMGESPVRHRENFDRGQANKNQMEQPSRGWSERGRGGGISSGTRGGHTQTAAPLVGGIQHEKEVCEVTEEFKTMTVTPSHKKEETHFNRGRRGTDNRRNTMPPRLQESMKVNKSPIHGDQNAASKPKRYSSQRQRPSQDQVVYQQGYYEQNHSDAGYQGNLYEGVASSPNVTIHSVPSIPHPQLTMATGNAPPAFVPPSFTTAPPSYPPEPFIGRPPAPRMTALVAQPHLIGPAGPIAGPPPQVAGPPVPGGPVPPVTGPHFLPPDSMINYAAAAPSLVAAPQFPAAAFQAFTPVSQQQPQEIYSNGTMYYNTQSQQMIPKVNMVLPKRPKAVIPIVPPPDRVGRYASVIKDPYEVHGYTEYDEHVNESEVSDYYEEMKEGDEYVRNVASEIPENTDMNIMAESMNSVQDINVIHESGSNIHMMSQSDEDSKKLLDQSVDSENFSSDVTVSIEETDYKIGQNASEESEGSVIVEDLSQNQEEFVDTSRDDMNLESDCSSEKTSPCEISPSVDNSSEKLQAEETLVKVAAQTNDSADLETVKGLEESSFSGNVLCSTNSTAAELSPTLDNNNSSICTDNLKVLGT